MRRRRKVELDEIKLTLSFPFPFSSIKEHPRKRTSNQRRSQVFNSMEVRLQLLEKPSSRTALN